MQCGTINSLYPGQLSLPILLLKSRIKTATRKTGEQLTSSLEILA